jgi:hypothetical protein
MIKLKIKIENGPEVQPTRRAEGSGTLLNYAAIALVCSVPFWSGPVLGQMAPLTTILGLMLFLPFLDRQKEAAALQDGDVPEAVDELPPLTGRQRTRCAVVGAADAAMLRDLPRAAEAEATEAAEAVALPLPRAELAAAARA